MRIPRMAALVVFAAVALAGCDGDSTNNIFNSQQRVVGSGTMGQETRSVSGFSAVSFLVEGELHIEQGAQEALRIEAEDNLLSYLQTQVVNNTLQIRGTNGIDLEPTLSIEFYLTLTDLSDLTHAGVGSIDIVDLVSPQLSLTLSGVGSIDVTNLMGQDLDVTLDGVGGMRVDGTVDTQNVIVSGVGDYDAEDLASVHATVVCSSSGNATVRVSGTLDATIRDLGSIFYIGDPVVTSDITGQGELRKIG